MRAPKDLVYVKTVRARGHVYYYFDTGPDARGKHVYVRLPNKSDMAFGGAYAAQMGARTKREGVAETPTISFASNSYQRDPDFKDLSASTQNTYYTYLKVLEDEMGIAPVGEVRRADIRALLDKHSDRPGAANMLLLVIRNVFTFALQREWVKASPTIGITSFKKGEETHEPWPETLIAEALDDPTVRLPVALLYFTAQRIGDVCAMRWSSIQDGYIEVKQQKTGKELDIRLHTELARILADTPKEAMTILHGSKMRPLRSATLRLQLQKWAKAKGHEIVPHGLRKNAVNALLEAGCTVGETSAISGQSLGMVERYAKRRNNRKLGSAAVLKWEQNVS
jgi:integrase